MAKGAKCPNHGTVLDKTGKEGVGICPISGALFEYKAEEGKEAEKVDVYGNIYKELIVKQIDGGNNG